MPGGKLISENHSIFKYVKSIYFWVQNHFFRETKNLKSVIIVATIIVDFVGLTVLFLVLFYCYTVAPSRLSRWIRR